MVAMTTGTMQASDLPALTAGQLARIYTGNKEQVDYCADHVRQVLAIIDPLEDKYAYVWKQVLAKMSEVRMRVRVGMVFVTTC
jgi:hypothetical protein